MTHTIGIDIGSGAVKSALFRNDGDRHIWLAKCCERIRRRDPQQLAQEGFDAVLAEAKLAPEDIDYIATTGEGENVRFATGHFYSMTTHARGGVFLCPEANAVVDIGALNGRAIYIDARGKVLSYKMTSQCASGSGQFLENIARYLGVAVEEIGPLSKTSENPERVSSICAVLAETDVINMVSLDVGLLAAIQEEALNEKVKVSARSHPDSIYAGAIGAALWGAFRHQKLRELEARAAA
ncbi:MAG: BadF/BadG/BcrA/BcrD ATPase family protein [Betaproteobacteria bacterium]